MRALKWTYDCKGCVLVNAAGDTLHWKEAKWEKGALPPTRPQQRVGVSHFLHIHVANHSCIIIVDGLEESEMVKDLLDLFKIEY